MGHANHGLVFRWHGLLKIVWCSCGYIEAFLSRRAAYRALRLHQ